MKEPLFFKIWSLADDFSLQTPKYELYNIQITTHGPEEKPLIFIHTEGGKELGLTTEHAVLLESGEMVAAKTLKQGQKLVSALGKPVVIQKIEQRMIQEDVLNLLTSGTSMLSHLILAEGLIVGDLAWQNSLQGELNAVLIRQ